ncbi:MAG TPA: hypothetical protein VFK04_08545 [Gemmatimonadaceae bacterium]|nr:hypothetical protein [Gemmatimonadaceae bacterium]
MRRSLTVFAFLSFFLAACATAGASGASSSNTQAPITAQEISSANLPDAYALVDRLRRTWFRNDPGTGEAVSVYMDQQKLGGTSALRDIPTVQIAELRFLPSADAIQQFGPDAKGGAIVVVRKR